MRGVNIGRVQRFKIDPAEWPSGWSWRASTTCPRTRTVLLKSSGLLGGMVAEIVPGKSTKDARRAAATPCRQERGGDDGHRNRVAGQAETVPDQRAGRCSRTKTSTASARPPATSTAGSGQMRKLLAEVNVAVQRPAARAEAL